MKELILPTSELLPTQGSLSREKLDKVIKFYRLRRQQELLLPAVALVDNEYLVIDGHHRVTIAALTTKETPVALVSSLSDFFTQEQFPRVPQTIISDSNYVISQKFTNISQRRDYTAHQRIITFDDLMEACELDTYSIHQAA